MTVGDNASVDQHHLHVLDALGRLRPPKARLLVIVAMTHRKGGGASHEQRVRERMRELGLPGRILTDHLEGEDWARLSLSADFFVHAQPTDAASTSVQEHPVRGCGGVQRGAASIRRPLGS